MEERQQLLDYQVKLDEARDRLHKGEITQDDLDRLKRELAVDMPGAVRAKLDPERPRADPVPVQATAAVLPSDMDALMRQTGLGTSGPMPG